jgi:tetratricopeptide (TPR) repeat protein
MKKILFTTLIVLGAWHKGFAQDGLSYYVDGENLRRSGQHEKAVQEFTRALQKEPNNYKYLYAKAQSEYQLKKTDAALTSLNSAIKLKDDFAPAYTMLAQIYRSKGDLERASSYYDQAFKYEEDASRKVQYKMLVMNKYLRDGNYEEALVKVKEAKAVAPNNEAVMLYYARICNRLGRYDEAASAVLSIEEKIKAAKPEVSAGYYFELGYAYYHQNQFDKAKTVWEKANFGDFKAKLERFGAKYSANVGLAYFKFYQNDLARSYAEKALMIEKDFPAAHVILTQLSKRTTDQAGVISSIQNAVNATSDPQKKLPLYIQECELELAAGRFDDAIATADKALAIKADDPKSNLNKAIAMYHKGMYKETTELVKKALLTRYDGATTAELNFLLGMSAKKMANTELAKQAFMVSLRSTLKDATEVELKGLKDFKLLEEQEQQRPADTESDSLKNDKGGKN